MLELERAFRDQNAQSLCPDEDTESRDLPKGKQVCGRTHTGPPSLSLLLAFNHSALHGGLPSPACWQSNHIGKAHLSFSDLNIDSCFGPGLTSSYLPSSSAFSHKPQNPKCSPLTPQLPYTVSQSQE